VAHTLPFIAGIMTTYPIRSIWSSLALALCFFAAPSLGQAQEVVEIHVSPEVLSLSVGERQRLFFTAVAKVDPDGTVIGVAPGVATLVVTAGRGSVNVRVSVGGGSTELASAAVGIVLTVDTLSRQDSVESGPRPAITSGGTLGGRV